MAVYLSKNIIEKSGYTTSEIITLLCVVNKVNYNSTINLLRRKGLIFCPITEDPMEYLNYQLTYEGNKLLENIVLDSDDKIEKSENLEELAIKLKAIYPKGIKPGTHSSWTEAVGVIINRLRTFFKKYGKYSHEQIIQATEQYVKSFNGSYEYMKTLKYFIFKDKKGVGGVTEYESDLATYIENAEHIEEVVQDWTSELK